MVTTFIIAIAVALAFASFQAGRIYAPKKMKKKVMEKIVPQGARLAFTGKQIAPGVWRSKETLAETGEDEGSSKTPQDQRSLTG